MLNIKETKDWYVLISNNDKYCITLDKSTKWMSMPQFRGLSGEESKDTTIIKFIIKYIFEDGDPNVGFKTNIYQFIRNS